MEALMTFIGQAVPWLQLVEPPILIILFLAVFIIGRKNRTAVRLLTEATNRHATAAEAHTAATKAANELTETLIQERERLHELVRTLTGAKGVIVGVAVHPVDDLDSKPH